MTVTVVATGANSKQTQLVVKQTEVTALAAAAVTPSNQQLLKQKAEELVRGCIDCSRLTGAAIIAAFPTVFTSAWLAKFHPEIALLTTAGNQPSLLSAAQGRAVDDAMAQSKLSAYTDILSVMT